MLLMNAEDQMEMKCPSCESENFERVLSTANYSVGGGAGKPKGATSQTRTCSGGSCTTYDIPGPA